jgi:sugar transferase (PEP-CTERM/EpsH1 system associated)
MPIAPGLPAEGFAAVGERQSVPLIAHVIFRLDVGGLENGLVNLINSMPVDRFRHLIICLSDYSAFRRRIQRSDVPVYALHKPPGNSPMTQFRLWRLLKRLRPDVIHTRNLAALEGMLPAALAGVPVRIHGEHGRDVDDLDGTNTRRKVVRQLFRPFVHQYITVSRDLGSYLQREIGVPPSRISQIYNGVDSVRFHPAIGRREELPCDGFAGPGNFVIGTVGRMQDVKDQLTLARAFVRLTQAMPGAKERLRLVMIGEGPLRERVRVLLAEAGVERNAWLPGERDDVARIMRCFDLFVLPSLAEGISNTILEAMASGLPVLATAVGGKTELIEAGATGTLVPRDDPERMARAIRGYAESPELCRRHGSDGRKLVERTFGMEAMVNAYVAVYDRLLAGRLVGARRQQGSR